MIFIWFGDGKAKRVCFLDQVEASKKDIPSGFKMPKSEQDFMPNAPTEIEEDDNL